MTLTEINDALIENADFEEVSSVAKAKAFATAATRWFILAPSSASKEGSSLSMNSAQIENLLRRARDYIAVNDTSSTGRRPSVKFLRVGDRQ